MGTATAEASFPISRSVAAAAAAAAATTIRQLHSLVGGGLLLKISFKTPARRLNGGARFFRPIRGALFAVPSAGLYLRLLVLLSVLLAGIVVAGVSAATT